MNMYANVASPTPCGTNGCGCWPAAETATRNIINVGTGGTLLSLQDGAMKANEEVNNFNYCRAQFFVDTASWHPNPDAEPVLVYRLRPVSKPHKYVDVSGGQVVLTDVPCQNNSTQNTCSATAMLCESSFNFIPDAGQGGHFAFVVRLTSSSAPEYLSTDAAANVVVANSRSWFKLDEPSGTSCRTDNFLWKKRIESNPVATSHPTDRVQEQPRRQRNFWKNFSCFQ